MNSKISKNNNMDTNSTINVKKKPRKRIIRATWFDKEEFEKILKLFQKYYPKDFPEKKTVGTIPKLSLLKFIKKEQKINFTDIILSRFFHQYVAIQQNKSLSSKKYEILLELTQSHYPNNFSKDYSKTPTRSIFNKIKKEKKITISHLTMCRFFNQYLKKQKYFLRKQEKQNEDILASLQNIYPDAFPKDSKKLLKLGIFEDIKKDGKLHTTDDDLKSFLNHYTKQEDYLQCYFDTPVRHDIHGNIVAPTTKQERFFAKKLLKKLQKK